MRREEKEWYDFHWWMHKMRQVIAAGKVVTLYGETTIQGSNHTEHQPRIPQTIIFENLED